MHRVIDNNYDFYMGLWTNATAEDEDAFDEHDAHVCDTAACFGGWLALSSEFKRRGGYLHPIDECPVYANHYECEAIAHYFGWSYYFSKIITACDPEWCIFYDVSNISEITPEMVLTKLLDIKAGRLNTTGQSLETI